jgi:hypothetical protein
VSFISESGARKSSSPSANESSSRGDETNEEILHRAAKLVGIERGTKMNGTEYKDKQEKVFQSIFTGDAAFIVAVATVLSAGYEKSQANGTDAYAVLVKAENPQDPALELNFIYQFTLNKDWRQGPKRAARRLCEEAQKQHEQWHRPPIARAPFVLRITEEVYAELHAMIPTETVS